MYWLNTEEMRSLGRVLRAKAGRDAERYERARKRHVYIPTSSAAKSAKDQPRKHEKISRQIVCCVCLVCMVCMVCVLRRGGRSDQWERRISSGCLIEGSDYDREEDQTNENTGSG